LTLPVPLTPNKFSKEEGLPRDLLKFKGEEVKILFFAFLFKCFPLGAFDSGDFAWNGNGAILRSTFFCPSHSHRPQPNNQRRWGLGSDFFCVCGVCILEIQNSPSIWRPGRDNASFGFRECRLGLLPAVISPFVMNKIGRTHCTRYFLTAEVRMGSPSFPLAGRK